MWNETYSLDTTLAQVPKAFVEIMLIPTEEGETLSNEEVLRFTNSVAILE